MSFRGPTKTLFGTSEIPTLVGLLDRVVWSDPTQRLNVAHECSYGKKILVYKRLKFLIILLSSPKIRKLLKRSWHIKIENLITVNLIICKLVMWMQSAVFMTFHLIS